MMPMPGAGRGQEAGTGGITNRTVSGGGLRQGLLCGRCGWIYRRCGWIYRCSAVQPPWLQSSHAACSPAAFGSHPSAPRVSLEMAMKATSEPSMVRPMMIEARHMAMMLLMGVPVLEFTCEEASGGGREASGYRTCVAAHAVPSCAPAVW